MEHPIDAGLLILRVFFGLVLAAHGSQKLLGWFGGGGLDGTTAFFASIGYPRRRELAFLGGLTEFAGGLALAIGFLTPLVSLAFVAFFVNVMWSAHSRSFWSTQHGIEYPLSILIVTSVFALTGPGRFSVDRAFGWRLSGWAWYVVALVIGFAVGAIMLSLRRPPASVPDTTAEIEPGQAA